MKQEKLPLGFVRLSDGDTKPSIESEGETLHVTFTLSKLVHTYKDGVWTFYDTSTDVSPA